MKKIILFLALIFIHSHLYSESKSEFEFLIDGAVYNLNPKNLPKCIEVPFDNCYGSINPPGRKYSGEFKNGNFNGFGKLEWENGIIFLGEFNNDKLNGFGKKFIKGKLDFDGRFENGMPQGYLSKDEKQEKQFKRVIKESNEYQKILKGDSAENPNASDNAIESKSPTPKVGQNASNHINTNSSTELQCDGYGFERGTNPYAQCLMQIDIAQRQANTQKQERANREYSCQMAKANAYLKPTRTGNFFESQELANQTYNNCMSGLPPPSSGLINCHKSGDNITCFAQ